MMHGVFDYRGECFGYIVAGKLYDLEHRLAGQVTEKAIFALDGTLVWRRDRHGLYNLHWESVGYIGDEVQTDDANR